MANFHVRTEENGNIYAVTVDKNGKVNNKCEVTKEALEAVKEHFLRKSVQEGKAMAYSWDYPTLGKTLFLGLEERNTEELKEERNE